MWDSKESVYKIIKPPQVFKPRTPPPTAKEFRDRKVAKITLRLKLMMRQKSAATFGKPDGHYKPCARKFLKKHSKEPVIIYEQQRCTQHVKRKPDVPRDRPVHGRVKILDFIKMNAEQMIHSRPYMPKGPKKMRRYLLKKTFGRIPTYLAARLKSAADQKKKGKDTPEERAEDCEHEGTRKLDEKERITMMNNLKLKWADTNARYQRLSVALDLESQKRMKEIYEENLLQLEKDVSLLSRKVILVSNSAPPKIRREILPPQH
ncbi:hypothetical protein M758_4G014200 [Ceratodon purpureus]|nr:hypothetical protein M758_4G014200 [Ceratodon purpureus]KAG0617777.1 hypothetical protein M758_4G014200 [Ceratodon purpureus]